MDSSSIVQERIQESGILIGMHQKKLPKQLLLVPLESGLAVPQDTVEIEFILFKLKYNLRVLEFYQAIH